jgi:hypothetical protein
MWSSEQTQQKIENENFTTIPFLACYQRQFHSKGCILILILKIDMKAWFKTNKFYKKRLVSRINPSLLLKIILYNTRTLQKNKI